MTGLDNPEDTLLGRAHNRLGRWGARERATPRRRGLDRPGDGRGDPLLVSLSRKSLFFLLAEKCVVALVEGCHVCWLDKTGVDGGSGGSGVVILEDGLLGVDAPRFVEDFDLGAEGHVEGFLLWLRGRARVGGDECLVSHGLNGVNGRG